MKSIRIESVTKKYGNVTSLDQVSLTVEGGELFFLVGASGCGKTTLLRSIAGLEPLNGGKIFFGNLDVTKAAAHDREAAMVFQNYALWPHMTVAENIAFGLEERKVKLDRIIERVGEVLKMVRLEGLEDRAIDELSGGQQQRVALARALIVKPTCLLLDEPLSNLDNILRLEMRAEIRRIVKENKLTAIYVTHDQDEALSMADRIAVIDEGKVQQVGTPAEIYRTPATQHVAMFMGETNIVKARVNKPFDDDGFLSVRVSADSEQFSGQVTLGSWRPEVGTEILISIRPEAFYIDNTGVPINRVWGEIKSITYLGSKVQYEVLDKHGQLWKVSEQNPHEFRKVGDYIRLKAEQIDVNILKP